jgi:hypothetical protein
MIRKKNSGSHRRMIRKNQRKKKKCQQSLRQKMQRKPLRR